jgi:hypothetical protein
MKHLIILANRPDSVASSQTNALDSRTNEPEACTYDLERRQGQ